MGLSIVRDAALTAQLAAIQEGRVSLTGATAESLIRQIVEVGTADAAATAELKAVAQRAPQATEYGRVLLDSFVGFAEGRLRMAQQVADRAALAEVGALARFAWRFGIDLVNPPKAAYAPLPDDVDVIANVRESARQKFLGSTDILSLASKYGATRVISGGSDSSVEVHARVNAKYRSIKDGAIGHSIAENDPWAPFRDWMQYNYEQKGRGDPWASWGK